MTHDVPAPRDAASVLLVRPRDGGPTLEVFMLRRHKKSGFMASAFVFPGGIAEAGDHGDPRATAARELFEEAGILLADREIPDATRTAWRQRLNSDETTGLADVLAEAGATPALDELHYLSHWITPSVEKRRYSATFYIAQLPPGQEPSFDNVETVDQVWVTADEALARAAELRLPPPQVRTFHDVRDAANRGIDALLALAAECQAHRHPILPRLHPTSSGFALLLPWDPDYDKATGAAHPMPAGHFLARGPSRFILENQEWKNVAVTSQPAD